MVWFKSSPEQPAGPLPPCSPGSAWRRVQTANLNQTKTKQSCPNYKKTGPLSTPGPRRRGLNNNAAPDHQGHQALTSVGFFLFAKMAEWLLFLESLLVNITMNCVALPLLLGVRCKRPPLSSSVLTCLAAVSLSTC